MSQIYDELAGLMDLTPAQLKEKWTGTEGSAPPSVPPAMLRRLVAQRLQERRHGALPALVARELARAASQSSAASASRPRVELTPGTRLVREWNGRTVTVEVLEIGFAHGDRTWRSLSEIARHVTGAHWSGPRFFGLTADG
ncbi:DUF2924 domain-containing protein [Tsuneonella sp. YG55]|uniref:DUF2924 domain-containing protein n=1 Tax=Tsuneonella litorea TaxID=2976475 RepID=A0A9X2VZJ2_9SPHN|nr:DUF2924 domain-containing protein [Tsuneonella litorea]MCT2558022.1 DUF2924 domain-containing protein [Tsuneonella litorea]